MTTKEKNEELSRHRDLLLATLDFLIEHQTGSIVFDGRDPARVYYEQQKLRVEKCFKERRLNQLKKQFNKLTESLQDKAALQYDDYIKEKTGLDFDLFKRYQEAVQRILTQGSIQTEEEARLVERHLLIDAQRTGEHQKEGKLNDLLHSYYKQKHQPGQKTGYSEVVKREEKDGITVETIRVFTGPKPKHFEEQWISSPDGGRRLRVVQWSDGKSSSTHIDISFRTASGGIYGVTGICPDVKAYWKDNKTIVIESKKGHQVIEQYKEVRSYDDVIAIEYIEH